MANKYIALVNGVDQEVAATVVGGTVSEAGRIIALDSNGRISQTILPVAVGADTYAGVAADTLSLVNPLVYINADGTVAASNASSSGTEAVGFVTANYTPGQTATVYFEGRMYGLSGLTVGARYYLSDVTPGGMISTPIDNTNPSNAGKKHQYIGRAITTSSLSFEADDYIILA